MSKGQSGRLKQMVIPTLIMFGFALIFTLVAYSKGQHIQGFKAGYQMTVQILPLLLFAFLMAGMVQAVLSPESVSKWIGDESGFRGILLGSVAGACTPGGPYVSLPIVVGLLRSGAGTGTLVAFMTGWSLWAFNRLPMEIAIIGWKLTVIRLLSVLIFPPLAGLVAQGLAKMIR